MPCRSDANTPTFGPLGFPASLRAKIPANGPSGFKTLYVEWTRQPSDVDQAEWRMRPLGTAQPANTNSGSTAVATSRSKARTASDYMAEPLPWPSGPTSSCSITEAPPSVTSRLVQERPWHRVQVMI